MGNIKKEENDLQEEVPKFKRELRENDISSTTYVASM